MVWWIDFSEYCQLIGLNIFWKVFPPQWWSAVILNPEFDQFWHGWISWKISVYIHLLGSIFIFIIENCWRVSSGFKSKLLNWSNLWIWNLYAQKQLWDCPFILISSVWSIFQGWKKRTVIPVEERLLLWNFYSEKSLLHTDVTLM